MAEPTRGDDATIAIPAGIVVGQLFADRYEVQALLGRGGMGAVYRVQDRAVDEVVALKLLDLAVANPEAVERFRREVRLARRVTHRNAARTYDLGEWQSWRYLTMELVDGESLRAYLGRGRPSRARVVEFTRQIAEGLAAAHEAGVVHRDLKPANVLVERSGRVVITDFGIARGLQGSEATMQTGGLLGTPAYMSPEQIAGEPIDARTDLYALGLILYEMLTGKLPFEAETALAMAMARLHRPLPDFRADPAIPASLVTPLERLLQREANARIASAKQLLELLDQARLECGHDQGTMGMTMPPRAGATGSATASATPTPSSMPSTSARALAVLPFRYRGPQSEAYIAETLSDELIDLLSTTRGLRVSGSGATARFADATDRDPRTIGSELNVDVIVDGTVQLAGSRVRISARLLAVEDGFQLWSERYDGALEDVFELQDKMGKRIAEALRLELEDIRHRGEAPAEAIEVYMRARALARSWEWKGPTGAVANYEAALSLAPSFKPAIAGHAIACLKAWFLPIRSDDEPDWAALARQAVERAEAEAPELAETQLAIAIHAVHNGDYKRAAAALRQALQIAPTYAAAHEYLGRLQVEAGQPEPGIRHLELAFNLNPGLLYSLPDIARYRALRGDLDGFERELERFYSLSSRTNDTPAQMLELRVAAWTNQADRIRRVYDRLARSTPEQFALAFFGRILVDEQIDAAGVQAWLAQVQQVARNPRFVSLLLQLVAECSAFRGFVELARDAMVEAAEGVLVDLDWLERCPVLAPLRSLPEYEHARKLVRSRAEAIWAV